MARVPAESAFPDPLRRREILYGKDTPRERLVEIGDRHLAAGQAYDALDFFEQAKDPEGLKKIKRWAIEQGEAPALHRVEKQIPGEVSTSDWGELAERAAAAGKAISELRAREGASDAEGAKRAAAAVAGAGLPRIVERFAAPEEEKKAADES